MLAKFGCGSTKKKSPRRSVAVRASFQQLICFLVLQTTFMKLLLLPTITPTHAQQDESLWFATWVGGKLCDKKFRAAMASWELSTSFTTLKSCCEAKFSYDFDNCCNPTLPGLASCLEEAGVNPHVSCTINVDCPWWNDPMRLERCATGPAVPDDITLNMVYDTREECCERQHPDSKYCNGNDNAVSGGNSGGGGGVVSGGNSGGYSHGGGNTDDDDFVDASKFELIPVKFSISNITDDTDITNLKETVRNVLQDFILELTLRYTDFEVSNVKETTRFVEDGGENKLQLFGVIDVYYDIKVIRVPKQEFGPFIIQEVIDSYPDILEDIQDLLTTEIYANMCMEGDQEAVDGSSLFNECSLQQEEVAAKFRFMDLPQEMIDNTQFFDNIKMEIMKAYKELLTDEEDTSIAGMILLSIADMAEVSTLPDGTIEVFFNIVVRGVDDGVAYASAIEEKIASSSSREVIMNRLETYTEEDTDWNVSWCTKEDGDALTVCTPAEKDAAPLGGVDAALSGVNAATKAFPVWGYAVIGGVFGLIVLFCLCCVCKLKCQGFSCCANRKVSRGRTRKAEALNQLNMESYIASGRPAQRRRRSSTTSKRTSFNHDRRVGDSGMRHNRRRRRSDGRHGFRSHHRREKRSSSRKRTRRVKNDSNNLSVTSLDLKQQENQMVLYEGEPTQQLVIFDHDDAEEQARKPDPDGIYAALMITGSNSIVTNGKEENNEQMLLEEGGGDRLVTFII